MHILCLIAEDLINPEMVQKKYSGEFRGRSRHDISSRKKELGRGTQASAKNDPNDPHMVKKHNIRPYDLDHRRDGFNHFINYLIQHDLTDNIHFPRVYNIKEITDKNDYVIYTYTIEKLIPYEKASLRELTSFVEHNFSKNWYLAIMANGLKEEEDGSSHINLKKLSDVVASHIYKTVSGGLDMDEVLRSESLIDALTITRKIGRDMGMPSDLHAGNLMWRRTSTGLTLIINDPLY